MPKSLAAGLFMILCLLAAPAGALEGPGTALPDLSLPALDGSSHSLKALTQDKVALVVYWSVSCPHCRQELPGLQKLSRRLDGNPFVMIMVNSDGPAMLPAVKAYVSDYKLPQPVLLDMGPDDSMPLGEALDIVATPTALVFNRKGILIHAQESSVDQKKLSQAVEGAF